MLQPSPSVDAKPLTKRVCRGSERPGGRDFRSRRLTVVDDLRYQHFGKEHSKRTAVVLARSPSHKLEAKRRPSQMVGEVDRQESGSPASLSNICPRKTSLRRRSTVDIESAGWVTFAEPQIGLAWNPQRGLRRWEQRETQPPTGDGRPFADRTIG